MRKKASIIFVGFLLSVNVMEAQQTINETIFHNGMVREYIVYVPANYDGATPVPLMFNFHGYTGQASQHINNTRMRPIADTAGFILVYPQGSLFFENSHWNVGSWTRGSTADDLGFTETMIDTLAAQYNIDLNRVYSCGYSNGGYFSFELACQLSHRIAAIGSVGGQMSSETYNSCNPQHPTPVVTIHGTEDNVVSYYGSQPVGSKSTDEVTAYWTTHNNTVSTTMVSNIPNLNTSDGSTVDYYSYDNGNHCVSVDHYKVIGGGHDWPGVWGNKDIDASSVIWNFVSKYDINGLIGCSTTLVDGVNRESSDILIYPNPSKTLVNIEMDLTEDMECHIYSVTGKLLLSRKISPSRRSIDISELPTNIYFLKVGSKVMKLIKTE